MSTESMSEKSTIRTKLMQIGKSADTAGQILAYANTTKKNEALNAAARSIRENVKEIVAANAADMAYAKENKLNSAMLDRLALTVDRIEAMASSLEEIARLPDPVGIIQREWKRPNGLSINRLTVPIGVIGIIYESRPNVTADAGALCLKSGNAAILRSGSECFLSSTVISTCLRHGLESAGLPNDCVQMIPTRDRTAVGEMLTLDDYIDLIIPRGGRSLIKRVAQESRVPILAHLEGVCTVYVHEAAKLAMSRNIILNSKMRRTGICGAAENIIMDRSISTSQLPSIVDTLVEAGCEVRGDEEAQNIDKRIVPASVEDWSSEYLSAIISVKIIDGLRDAIAFIAQYGSHHTDTIVTEDIGTAEKFLSLVDSGIVLHNASTQFADGGEFGMGAEIGISTSKIHARGPVGLEQLISYKYVVRGHGQCRP